jgi:MFS transporter, MCT family, solute carrier family 16 (monocarboxylic acid transporters), member 10
MNPILGHWFKRRAGLANAIMTSGSAIGGSIIPIAARNLIPRVGFVVFLRARFDASLNVLMRSLDSFPWTMRIIAFILLCTLSIPNLTLRRRLPPKKASGDLLGLHLLKSPTLSVYILMVFINYLGLYTGMLY